MQKQDKQALAQAGYEKAMRYEMEYGACPQCVLMAIQETIGGVDDSTIKASHGLAGGGGLTGKGTCGALIGGLMALSAKRGRDRDKLDKGRFISNFKQCRELAEKFEREFGGVTCEALQEAFTGRTYDIWNEEEYKDFKAARGERCANATGTVAKWLIEMS
ncbi:MAG: C-GCAxxG-C-C family protein [Gammaproteobacteria bacterium]|nr:C-GCAxxG-C-C family protein [Gammaproteobacteria bacterium]NNJ83366.1 C_GCAxxG_C_C family protein [Gammaproteobacteria bacterium]